VSPLPGWGPVADDQRRAQRFCGGVADAVAGQPVEREPGKRCPHDDLVLVRPVGRHADQGMAAGGDAGHLEHRGVPGERRGEQVAPPAVDDAHLADVPVEHPAFDEPGERQLLQRARPCATERKGRRP